MRIVELPLPLCPPGSLALAILVARPSLTHTGHVIWLGDNFDFDGSTPPESYQVMQAHVGFAKSGVVLVDYPADTFTLDFDIGLRVRLDEIKKGVSTTLDEQTGTNGLANDLLVFVGNEILSVVGITLEGAGTYRLQVARGRYATSPETHSAGAEVYIIAREDLLALTHPTFQPGATVTFKVALSTGRFTQDLSEVEAIEIEMTGRALQVAPSNLRVNREHRNARYTPSTDVLIQWSLPDQRDLITQSFPFKARTLVEIVSDADDSVLWSKLTTTNVMKLGGAKMDLIRGAETTFTVRLTTDVLGVEHHVVSPPITLNVTST